MFIFNFLSGKPTTPTLSNCRTFGTPYIYIYTFVHTYLHPIHFYYTTFLDKSQVLSLFYFLNNANSS